MIPLRPTELLSALNREGVDYVLIGGLAAAIRGTTRVTRDIDIAYATPSRNLERLCEVLNRFEPRRIRLGVASDTITMLSPELLKHDGVLQLSTTLGEVDLLNLVDGFKSYGGVKKLSEPCDLPNVSGSVYVMNIDGLLKAKRAMNRPKDRQDIVELDAIKQIPAAGPPSQD